MLSPTFRLAASIGAACTRSRTPLSRRSTCSIRPIAWIIPVNMVVSGGSLLDPREDTYVLADADHLAQRQAPDFSQAGHGRQVDHRLAGPDQARRQIREHLVDQSGRQ